MKKDIIVYTDGASRGNPGPGGWAAIVIAGDVVHELAGAKNPATNNQMELQAVIEGLGFAQTHFPQGSVALHADSAYVLNGIEKWLDGWVRKGWITATTKKPVENKAQWQKLLALRDALGTRLALVKVEGHSGHQYNDRCDELAVAAALGKKPEFFRGTAAAYAAYLAEHPPKSPTKKTSKSTSSKAAYSYVSLVGGKVYADKTWATCEQRVKGVKGAKYKKVFSKAEETDLIQDYTLLVLLK